MSSSETVTPTLGLRHAVLWVNDPAASARFYEEALGLEIKSENDNGAFLSSPDSETDHDLGLFRAKGDPAPPGNVGLYHIAWEVGTLAELVEAKERLTRMGSYVGENNHGVSRSLYCKDPDGIEFEVMWELPEELHGTGWVLDAESRRIVSAHYGRRYEPHVHLMDRERRERWGTP